jgi:hypothetical protein
MLRPQGVKITPRFRVQFLPTENNNFNVRMFFETDILRGRDSLSVADHNFYSLKSYDRGTQMKSMLLSSDPEGSELIQYPDGQTC